MARDRSSAERQITLDMTDERKLAMRGICVHYSHFVDDVLNYYSGDALLSSSLVVYFVTDREEKLRKLPLELFVGFWDRAFDLFFEGCPFSQLPRTGVSPNVLTAEQCRAVGRLMGHGFSLTGYLPVNGFNKAALAFCLSGEMPQGAVLRRSFMQALADDTQDMLDEVFELCVASNEKSVFGGFFSKKEEKERFPAKLEFELNQFFNYWGVNYAPSPLTFEHVFERIAAYQCVERVHFQLHHMRLGLLETGPSWANTNVELAVSLMDSCDQTGHGHPDFSVSDSLFRWASLTSLRSGGGMSSLSRGRSTLTLNTM